MMFPYPFSRYPYYTYPHNPYFNNSNVNQSDKHAYNSNNNSSKNTNSVDSEETRNYGECNNSIDYFEIFGLKLYFDDILLICIIFFLYNEGVKDEGLFIALILLLLS